MQDRRTRHQDREIESLPAAADCGTRIRRRFVFANFSAFNDDRVGCFHALLSSTIICGSISRGAVLVYKGLVSQQLKYSRMHRSCPGVLRCCYCCATIAVL